MTDEGPNTVETSHGNAAEEARGEGDMSIHLKMPDITELKPRITVYGVGGAGGNAVNNMIQTGLLGCDFVVANTDAQALSMSKAERIVQMGVDVTEGLGAGSQPEIGRAAAEEVIDEINDYLSGSHMVFITAGMGGGTGTGAAPVIAKAAKDAGILTVGVVTKPFQFEGQRRMRIAEDGILELQKCVDTLIVIPNQNLFRIANEKTTFADAFAMADEVLYSGVACITDLMVKEGLINLDFADVRSVMKGMGKAMMGTGEASGDQRAIQAAEAAIANPLLDETTMKGAQGLLISITGGNDLTLFEVDEAATRIREEVDQDANIILGATFDESLEGLVRVSVVATGIENSAFADDSMTPSRLADLAERLRMPNASAAPQVSTTVEQPIAATSIPEAPAPTEAAAAPEVVRDATAAIEAELALPEQMEFVPEGVPTDIDPEVTIEPLQANPRFFEETEQAADPIEEPIVENYQPAEPYVPPMAELPEAQLPSMPSIEDFPPIAQQEMRGGDVHEDDDRRPMSLLRRLAGGISRRDGESDDGLVEHGEQPVVTQHVPQEAVPPMAPAPQPVQRTQQQEAMYRPRQGDLDAQGRAQPRQVTEDDQLEIPAFLRRQAN